MRWPRTTWPLASHLLALLGVAMLLTFTVVAGTLVAWRVPAIEQEDREALQREAEDVSRRLESLLGTAESRISLAQMALDDAPRDQASRVLAQEVRNSLVLGALYSVSADGVVTAAGVAPAHAARQGDLLGMDLLHNPLVRALSSRVGAVWDGRYLSPLTALRTVGMGLRDPLGRVLLAEMEYDAYLKLVLAAAGSDVAAFWIVDRSGEVIVDSDSAAVRGHVNLRGWPLLQAALQQKVALQEITLDGQAVLAAATYSRALDWYLVTRRPTGLDHPQVRNLLSSVALSLGACLLTGVFVAMFWARRLARPLQAIVARARATAQSRLPGVPLAPGSVAELNALARELDTMAGAMRKREQRFLAIFNAAPIPMSVADVGNALRLLDVNEAWCRDLKRQREDALGRTGIEIGLWSLAERDRFMAERQGDKLQGEARIRCGDGTALQMQVFGQRVRLPSQELLVWATVDIGPLRARQTALRELNQALETRVVQRTEALAEINAVLARNVEQLRAAQDELVRSGTMAALGGLVAGVAHELNTPLGNSLMAISALASVQQRLEAAMAGGLRRADLQTYLAGLREGTDIALRNLRRAAELVQSFKQVAVDQTSAKRRPFALHEVVHELVASLRPSYARTPYRIEVQVPASGLAMDSYPGALGQALAHLVHNAMLHAFEGCDHGTVRIDARLAADGAIVLRVCDDGRGIAPDLLDRIFDPFVTTRMGRGGTGLGLHISHNAVAQLLGGTLTVQSAPGEGTCFALRMPAKAPRTPRSTGFGAFEPSVHARAP
ncbi:ATP-binding protein [Pseudorhodoferax sp. Leaf267]|uniref:sensor histidine kinase n=1 Tax=Pseudorhodoferax sp. Leaf267 TaxID=1736316 RepID=UPI0006FC4385|nr:ATP-binding protein [Pseudorhodoferax sp. Leaf267]KQP17661.1 hypothetical protein ASF43_07165 [Pseudorhodoferax sp. Leaf267]